MANIITSGAQNSGFIPNVWAARALDVLRSNIVLTKLIAKDTEYEPGWVGQTLTIPYPGTFSAQAKSENALATVQTPQNGGIVTLTLSNHEYVDFLVEDLARTQASGELMDRFVQPAAIALAEKLETDLVTAAVADWTVNNAVGTAGTNIGAAQIRAARQVLNQQKVPTRDRAMAVSSKDEVALLADPTLATYFAFSQNDAIKEGSLGRLYGFDVYMSQIIGTDANNQSFTVVVSGTPTGGTYTITVMGQTTSALAFNATQAAVLAALEALPIVGSGNVSVVQTGSTPNFTNTISFIGDLAGESIGGTVSSTGISVADSTTGGSHSVAGADVTAPKTTNLAFHPNALMLGMRPFRDIVPNSGVESAIMTDPESGIMIRVMHQYNIGYRAHYVAFDILYGFSALRPNHGVLINS